MSWLHSSDICNEAVDLTCDNNNLIAAHRLTYAYFLVMPHQPKQKKRCLDLSLKQMCYWCSVLSDTYLSFG